MKFVKIYQTLEDRENDDEIQAHGPFFCSANDDEGNPKTGIRTPWLGEGYYFWDSILEDAKWWGDVAYDKYGKGYLVCETEYDQHSDLLFDLVGDIATNDDFFKCAECIKKKKGLKKITFQSVLEVIKLSTGIQYKAIRACPIPKCYGSTKIVFPDENYSFHRESKVQICFFDETLLTKQFTIVYKKATTSNSLSL